MLSELAARFESEKVRYSATEQQLITKEEEEPIYEKMDKAVVPYSRPPSYVPTAPSGVSGKDVSLDILNNAMSNTTGATNAMKMEKTAYSSYAEAMRDSVPVQNVKTSVNALIIPRLRNELSGLKRKRTLVHIALIVTAAVTMITSFSSLVKDFQVSIPSGTESGNSTVTVQVPKWFASFSAVFNTVNLVATGLMISFARMEKMLDGQIGMIKKEIMKKESYNEAVRKSVTAIDMTSLFQEAEGANG
uniref:NS3 n=1 Tax=Wallal virus TaxID=40061 RepID=A0A097I4E1_9REOV|nr:NS3 [Wallal virus]